MACSLADLGGLPDWARRVHVDRFVDLAVARSARARNHIVITAHRQLKSRWTLRCLACDAGWADLVLHVLSSTVQERCTLIVNLA